MLRGNNDVVDQGVGSVERRHREDKLNDLYARGLELLPAVRSKNLRYGLPQGTGSLPSIRRARLLIVTWEEIMQAKNV